MSMPLTAASSKRLLTSSAARAPNGLPDRVKLRSCERPPGNSSGPARPAAFQWVRRATGTRGLSWPALAGDSRKCACVDKNTKAWMVMP
jgi:hypothetical protein